MRQALICAPLILLVGLVSAAPCLLEATQCASQPIGWLLLPAQGIAFADDTTLEAATAVVEEYWTSEPKSRYALLSRAYKQRLQQLGVSTAGQYELAIHGPERVWGKRSYRSKQIVASGKARVDVLVEWEQEGYTGVMSFVFDVVRDGDRWRIANIVH